MTTDPPDAEPAAQRLDVAMGIDIVEASADRVVATMPVAGNTQPFGLLHGGATCVLAETVGSIAATLHAGDGKVAVGVDINATHHRAKRDGMVTGVATPLHRGRSVTCYEIAVSDEEGRRIATARLTCQIVDAPGVTHELLATPTRDLS